MAPVSSVLSTRGSFVTKPPCRRSHTVSGPRKPVGPRCILSGFQRLSPPAKWAGGGPHSSGVAVLSTVGTYHGAQKIWNQDVWLVENVHPAPSLAATTIGIFDGHGPQGHYVARHVAEQVAEHIHHCARQNVVSPAESRMWWDPDYLPPSTNLPLAAALCAQGTLPDFPLDSAQACLEQTFRGAADSVGQNDADAHFSNSGSTAVVCMLLPDSVVSAWTGDCRAVVGTAEGNHYTATQLTRDHKPEKLSEWARIVTAGGRVSRPASDKQGKPIGPYRVSLPGGTPAALSVARAFGDLQLARAGVVPTPELSVYSRDPTAAAPCSHGPAEMLLVASDGLWEVVGNQEAVDIAAGARNPEQGVEELAAAAKKRWTRRYGGRHCDDITVAVAFL